MVTNMYFRFNQNENNLQIHSGEVRSPNLSAHQALQLILDTGPKNITLHPPETDSADLTIPDVAAVIFRQYSTKYEKRCVFLHCIDYITEALGYDTELTKLEKLHTRITDVFNNSRKPVDDEIIELNLTVENKKLIKQSNDSADRKSLEVETTQPNKPIETCDPAKIAESININNRGKPVTKKDVENFLIKGGVIQILKDQAIPLSRSDRYIVGCTSGINRSQTHAAYLRKEGVAVDGILAGGDSAFNPAAEFPMVSGVYCNGTEEEKAFYEQFHSHKCNQIGPENVQQFDDVEGSVDFYKNFINELQPTHFIAYAASGQSVLHRLLERKGDSLKGFKLTYIDWADQIAHPPENVKAFSQGAYALFEDKILKYFPVVD